ncbi:Na(+)/H(+) antiporter subunit C [Parafrankia sp. FMc6]|uniref:Na(+)/H(+) antiporter subunit C n=1 Tax=Parafrankia soli TaxID=2599596 RepID=UPI0034D49826
MSPVNLTSALVVGGLYTAGTYLLLQRSLMRVLIGLVLLGHGTNLLLLLVGGESGQPPMVGSARPEDMSDPLPQGMALTSIVITFALTTFLLALAYRAWTLLGDDEVRDDIEDARISRLESGGSAHPEQAGPPGTAGQPDGDDGAGQLGGGPADGAEQSDREDREPPREPGELAVPGLLERCDAYGRRP